MSETTSESPAAAPVGLKPESKAAQVRALLASGLSTADIVKQVGCTANLVYVLRSKQRRPAVAKVPRKKKPAPDPESQSGRIRALLLSGLGVADIAEKLGAKRTRIYAVRGQLARDGKIPWLQQRKNVASPTRLDGTHDRTVVTAPEEIQRPDAARDVAELGELQRTDGTSPPPTEPRPAAAEAAGAGTLPRSRRRRGLSVPAADVDVARPGATPSVSRFETAVSEVLELARNAELDRDRLRTALQQIQAVVVEALG